MDFTVVLHVQGGTITGTVVCDCIRLNYIAPDDEETESVDHHVGGHIVEACERNDWFHLNDSYVLPPNPTLMDLTMAGTTRTPLAVAPERIIAFHATEVSTA